MVGALRERIPAVLGMRHVTAVVAAGSVRERGNWSKSGTEIRHGRRFASSVFATDSSRRAARGHPPSGGLMGCAAGSCKTGGRQCSKKGEDNWSHAWNKRIERSITSTIALISRTQGLPCTIAPVPRHFDTKGQVDGFVPALFHQEPGREDGVDILDISERLSYNDSTGRRGTFTSASAVLISLPLECIRFGRGVSDDPGRIWGSCVPELLRGIESIRYPR